jgi:hypothetical protein
MVGHRDMYVKLNSDVNNATIGVVHIHSYRLRLFQAHNSDPNMSVVFHYPTPNIASNIEEINYMTRKVCHNGVDKIIEFAVFRYISDKRTLFFSSSLTPARHSQLKSAIVDKCFIEHNG